jgi:hypothetical protein
MSPHLCLCNKRPVPPAVEVGGAGNMIDVLTTAGTAKLTQVDSCKRLYSQYKDLYSPVDSCKRLRVQKASTGKFNRHHVIY